MTRLIELLGLLLLAFGRLGGLPADPAEAEALRLVSALSEKCSRAQEYFLEGEMGLNFVNASRRTVSAKIGFVLAVSGPNRYALRLYEPVESKQTAESSSATGRGAPPRAGQPQGYEIDKWVRESSASAARAAQERRKEYWRICDGRNLWLYVPMLQQYAVRAPDDRNIDFEIPRVLISYPEPADRLGLYIGLELGPTESLPDEGDPAECLLRLVVPMLARLQSNAVAIDSTGPQKIGNGEGARSWRGVRVLSKPRLFSTEGGMRIQNLVELMLDPSTLTVGRLVWTNVFDLDPMRPQLLAINFTRFSVGDILPDAALSFVPPAGAKRADHLALPGQTGSALVGGLAPEFIVEDLDGVELRFSSLRGRPVLIAFWGSTPGSGGEDCPECLTMPFTLQKLHEEYGKQGLVVLGVSNQPRDRAREVVTEAGLTFRVLDDSVFRRNLPWKVIGPYLEWRNAPAAFALDYLVGQLFRVQRGQSVYLVDKDGTVVGFLRDISEASLRAMLNKVGFSSAAAGGAAPANGIPEALSGPSAAPSVWTGATFRVENPAGNIALRVETRDKAAIRHTARGREALPGDIRVNEEGDLTTVKVESGDGAAVDLDIVLPYGVYLEASAEKGSISFSGMIFRARFTTGTGDIRVAAPWSYTRAVVTSVEEPGDFSRPRRLPGNRSSAGGVWGWTSEYRRLDICCDIRISGRRPGRVELVDLPLPPDAPLKLPSQAKTVLESILDGRLMAKARQKEDAAAPASLASAVERDGTPVFASSVRLVNLAAAVRDREGHPATGLKPEDFEVLEDGVPQKLATVVSGEVDVNLALLLELTTASIPARSLMQEAVRQFLGVRRMQDRAAVYAMSRAFFQVGSSLTGDRQRLEGVFEPMNWFVAAHLRLYDTITLACAEELLERPDERNALVIVGSGLDGQFMRGWAPSGVPFRSLRRAAQEMPILIFPVFFPYLGGTAKTRATARDNMQALADASGGRMFTVKSIGDLAAVAAQVAEELRSVYTLAYYPKNQNFDGKWRKIEVRVKRPDVKFRTRPGYYAR